MKRRARPFIKAVLIMAGTIIGAGIFGLPAAFASVGFWPGTILFFFLAGVVVSTHLMFTEVVLASKKKLRLTGHAREQLGPIGFQVATVSYPLQLIGACIAYIILGGEFIHVLMQMAGLNLSLPIWQLGFWAFGALIALYGLNIVSYFESWATGFLLIAIFVAVIVSAPFVEFANIEFGNLENWFLPFGVFLFSLSGLSIVSEAVEISEHNRRVAYGSVTVGTMIAALFSWIFGVTLYLAARGFPIQTTSDLISVMPRAWAWLIPVLGFLAVITSFVAIAEDLENTLVSDYKIRPRIASALALFTPLVLFILITRDFLQTISFVGAVFVGINAVIVCLLAWKIAVGYKRPVIRALASTFSILIMSVFIFGIVFKLFPSLL
jgi:amino acid permease